MTGQDTQVKIIDFGCSLHLSQAMIGFNLGTLWYRWVTDTILTWLVPIGCWLQWLLQFPIFFSYQIPRDHTGSPIYRHGWYVVPGLHSSWIVNWRPPLSRLHRVWYGKSVYLNGVFQYTENLLHREQCSNYKSESVGIIGKMFESLNNNNDPSHNPVADY